MVSFSYLLCQLTRLVYVIFVMWSARTNSYFVPAAVTKEIKYLLVEKDGRGRGEWQHIFTPPNEHFFFITFLWVFGRKMFFKAFVGNEFLKSPLKMKKTDDDDQMQSFTYIFTFGRCACIVASRYLHLTPMNTFICAVPVCPFCFDSDQGMHCWNEILYAFLLWHPDMFNKRKQTNKIEIVPFSTSS